MQVKAGQHVQPLAVDDVEQPMGKTAKNCAPHVAIDSLIQRRVGLQVRFDACKFVEKIPNPCRTASYAPNASAISTWATAL